AAAKTVLPGAGDPSIGTTFDPIAGSGACATASGADQAGAANYRLAVPAPGFTLLGSPTVIADLTATGTDSELAARLLDVLPDGKERLVARGLLRPGSGGDDVVFQLHPQGYRFAAGDTVKLELLPSDAPYARPSNLQAPITVSDLELRLPVREQPGALGGLVQTPAAPGRTAAPGIGGGLPLGVAGLAGRLRAGNRAIKAPLRCLGGPCQGQVVLRAGKRVLARDSYSLRDGAREGVPIELTKAGRKLVSAKRRAGKHALKIGLQLSDAGRPAPVNLTRPLRLR
ncbi:MAG TPA: CocE/NonD family hydrolase C-terminal non-catalytic domain-containing protein, partial [Solirubrobacterales bacterium]|nr:CocE/NonD family hydrolase C-terminal non-catalytic domain-containing protein [Solirubrobacterales bacterium]